MILDVLRESGAVTVGHLTEDQVGDVLTWLRSRPVYPGCHVRYTAGPETSWDAAQDANVLCWHEHDVLAAPHLFELATSMTDLAAEWLGVETPLLYSMNAFLTRPGLAVRPDIQDWHRDTDDVRFMPMFVLLTKTNGDGAQEIRDDKGFITRVYGPAGTVFLSDTMREHRGLKPRYAERIVAWARWGVTDPPASYVWDQLKPADKSVLGNRYPEDLRLRESIRLVVR